MTETPKNMTDIADFLVDWNDKAAAWMKDQREISGGGMSEVDEEFDQVTIFFDREGLQLFMRNQEAAAKWLRVVALFVAEREAAE